MKFVKEHKKDFIIFIFIFMLSLIMCSAFLQPHYAHDTYKIIKDGLTSYSYERFIQDARPFTAIITILADKIHMSVELYSVISLILGLIFLSCSVVIIYKLCIRNFEGNNKIVKIMILLISFLLVYNYLAIEYIYFLESFMLALGILLSIVSTKMIIDKQQYGYIKATILLVIAAFCYQGSIAIFPMFLFAYYLLFEKDNIKTKIITQVKISLIYGITMLLTILYSNILFESTRIQIGNVEFSFYNIWNSMYKLLVKSFNIIPAYMHIGIIVITILTICLQKKNRLELLLSYVFIIIASIVISLMPVIMASGLNIEPRTSMAFGTTIGISMLFLLYSTQTAKTAIKIIIYIFISVVFALNFFTYVIITNQHIMVNKIDKENCQRIKETIEEYEKETNIKVTKIAAVIRGNAYYHGFMEVGCMTQAALNTWALREAIIFYIERDLEFAPITDEQYDEYFKGKQWDEFSNEQMVIEGNVLYFCGN